MKRAAIGVRTHSGWGALVAVAVERGRLEVVERRRIVIAEPGMRGAIQPYHFAERLGATEAGEHIRRCAAASERLARKEIGEVARLLAGRGYRVAGCGILLASGRELPALEAILAAHPLIHTAEGEFYREAVRRACRRSRIRVHGYRERDLAAEAKATLGGAAVRRVATLGREMGPPWTSDQKSAALAAWLVLAA